MPETATHHAPSTPLLAGRKAIGAQGIWLIGALVLGAILRLYDIAHQGLWVDELYAVAEGRQPLSQIFNPNLHIQHPPGYRLLLHVWMGPMLTEAWIKLVPAIAGLALIVIAWKLARELWPGAEVAPIAALLIATSPFLVHYSRDVTTYSWTGMWITLSFLLVVLAWRRNKAWLWAAWGISLAVTMYSHYFAVFPLLFEVAGVAGVLLHAARTKRLERSKLIGASLAVVGAALIYVPWIYIVLTYGRDLPSVYFPFSVDDQPARWLATFLVGYSNSLYWMYQNGFKIILVLFAACLFWATWKLVRTRGTHNPLSVALVVGWCLAAAAGPYFMLRISYPPGSNDPVRFAAFAAPPLLLGLAALIVSMPKAVRALVLAAWLTVAGVQWWSELTAPPPQDWRSVMSVVAAQAKPGDAMLAFPAFHAGAAEAYYALPYNINIVGGWFVSEGNDPAGAGYWFPPGWHWQEFLDTHAERSADFPGELDKRTQGATRLWYLAGEGALDGNYIPSPSMERAIAGAGWQLQGEWHYAPFNLKLYTRQAAPAP